MKNEIKTALDGMGRGAVTLVGDGCCDGNGMKNQIKTIPDGMGKGAVTLVGDG